MQNQPSPRLLSTLYPSLLWLLNADAPPRLLWGSESDYPVLAINRMGPDFMLFNGYQSVDDPAGLLAMQAKHGSPRWKWTCLKHLLTLPGLRGYRRALPSPSQYELLLVVRVSFWQYVGIRTLLVETP